MADFKIQYFSKDKKFQASNFSEYMYREISEFVDVAGESCVEGLSMESVQMLPVCEYDHTTVNSISCSICLEVNIYIYIIIFFCLKYIKGVFELTFLKKECLE